MPMGDPGGNFAGTGGYGGNFGGYGGASNQSGSGGYGGTGGWGGQFGAGGYTSGLTGAGGFNPNGLGNGSMFGKPGAPSVGTGWPGMGPAQVAQLSQMLGKPPAPNMKKYVQQPPMPIPQTYQPAPAPQQPPPPGQLPWGGVDVNNPYRDRVWGAQAAAWPGGTSAAIIPAMARPAVPAAMAITIRAACSEVSCRGERHFALNGVELRCGV